MKRFLATVHVHAQALAFFVTNVGVAGIREVQQQHERDQPNTETIRGRHDVPAAAVAVAAAGRKAKRVKRTGARSTRDHRWPGNSRNGVDGSGNVDVPRGSDVVRPLSRTTTINARNTRRDAEKRRSVDAFGPGIGTVSVTDDSPRRRTTVRVVQPPWRVGCRRFSYITSRRAN